MMIRMLLGEAAERRYATEAVDECTHALQTAYIVRNEGCDDELVIAAALHDIGRLPSVIRGFGGGPHQDVAKRVLTRWLGPRVGGVVGFHVAAKRYLVAIDAAYAASLSIASRKSLEQQGGAFSDDEAATFIQKPFAEEAVLLRRADDRAKVPGAPELSIADVVDLFDRVRVRR